jgi:glutaminyl-tRNA synthetase
VVLSKRRLIQLVDEGHVAGWDDPRMPTLAGGRRRGYTPGGFRLFAERIGVAKADSWIDYGVLEDCMRENLNATAQRRIAVLDPVKLVIDNYPAEREEECHAPNHPQQPELGKRAIPFSRELWIEREDFQEKPEKGFFRLFPGNEVRLRYGFVVKCVGLQNGVLRCTYHPDSKSGTPGADRYKVKGNIHWVSAKHSHAAEVRLYDRLFKVPHPEDVGDLNPESVKRIIAYLEPSLKNAKAEDRFQFERHGYFVADRREPSHFNRTVTLRDSWKA